MAYEPTISRLRAFARRCSLTELILFTFIVRVVNLVFHCIYFLTFGGRNAPLVGFEEKASRRCDAAHAATSPKFAALAQLCRVA